VKAYDLHPFFYFAIWVCFPHCDGATILQGEPGDAREDMGTCGNGVRESGEACDGGIEACEGPQRCGGGVRRCLGDCTWGECEEDVFRLTAGPVTASGEMFARGQTNNILWTGEVFRLFFLGKTDDPDYPYGFEAYGTDVGMNGDPDGLPFIPTPPSLVELEPWDMTAQPLTGPNPYAFTISIRGDRNAVLDFIDAADRVVLDPAIDLQGDDVAMAKLFASSGTTLAAIYYRWLGLDTDRVAFIDAEGELIAQHDLPCEYDYPANGGMVVEDDGGFTVFYMCSLDPYGIGLTDYRLFNNTSMVTVFLSKSRSMSLQARTSTSRRLPASMRGRVTACFSMEEAIFPIPWS
jgi:hypothetical protein